MNDDWPFDQPRNCAVISLRQIVFDGAPILHVTHDADDHGWQFLTLDDAREEEASVVSLEQIVNLVRQFLKSLIFHQGGTLGVNLSIMTGFVSGMISCSQFRRTTMCGR